ncbi:MAG: transposase [Bacilli bacterium]|nr:transposase [Bacilli bacterium]
MGRHKGGRNKTYTKEEKLKYVKMMIDEGYSSLRIEKEFGISHSLTDVWRRKYLRFGEDSLENQKKPGNPLCKYQNKKNLTKEEQLEYENMKLRIENELLKKGYLMKGDGTIVKFTK